MGRLIVIPADPLYKYWEKGEIKARYWNPCGLFDEVHIISLVDSDIDAEKVQTLVGDARLHIHAIGRPTMWTLALFFGKVRRLVEQLKPDLIRAHGPWHTGSLAVWAGRALDIPTVVSVHSDRDAQRQHEPSLLLQMVRPLENFTLRNASVVLCVSDYLHAYARKHGAQRTYTVYNKVYSDRFMQKEAHRREGRLNVLSVMRLDRAKYPECLIEAIVPHNLHLKLIGQGELEQALRKLVVDLGVEDRVEFVRQVPNREIHKHYQEADIFVMATHYEGFCIPVLEAMAAGLPIVATDTGPIPEVLAGAGKVVAKDPRPFAQALADLVADPEARRALGTAARKRALEVDGSRMEERENHLYTVLMQRRHNELEALLSDSERFVN
ncbi:MAG: glycosyltransferase [Candidatus Latescibacterota bacterium]